MWWNGHDKEIKLLDRIFHILSDEEKILERDIGVPICVSNCGKCCASQSLLIQGVEARYIALWLSNQKQELQEKVKSICVDWLTEKHKNIHIYRGFSAVLDTRTNDRLNNDVAQLLRKTACPMLTEDKSCLIYPARPIACRTYGVTRIAPVDVCDRPPGKKEVGLFRAIRGNEKVDEAKQLVKELTELNDKKYITHFSFLCSRLLIELDPQQFLNLAYFNKIALAKMALVQSEALLWQDQVEDLMVESSEMSMITHPVPGGLPLKSALEGEPNQI